MGELEYLENWKTWNMWNWKNWKNGNIQLQLGGFEEFELENLEYFVR